MTTERQASVTIETPEGVSFSYPLAGPITRFAALVIDLLVIFAALSILGEVISRTFMGVSPSATAVLGIIAYFVVSIGYGMLLEWRWRGQTIGKRLLQVRVMDAEGLRLTFQQIAIRNLLRAVDSLPLYAVGGATMVVSRYAQRLGDMAAGTVVVRQARSGLVVPEAIRTGKYNSFATWPHLVGRLRQKAPLDLIAIAVNALERRDQFEPERRLELFHDLSERFRGIVMFPDEAGAFLTDEQYVRGLVDEMTRVRRR